jgi:hypothetical protein
LRRLAGVDDRRVGVLLSTAVALELYGDADPDVATALVAAVA